MWNAVKLVLLGLIVLGAAIAANYGRDLAYQIHAIIVLAVAGGLFIWTLRPSRLPSPRTPGWS